MWDRRGQGQPGSQPGRDREGQRFPLVSALTWRQEGAEQDGTGKEVAGAGRDLMVATRGGEEPPLQPRHHQQPPPAPGRGDAPGRRGSTCIGRALHPGQGDTPGLGACRPDWGSSPCHPVVELLARLVVDGYGHAGIRVEGKLHVVVYLGFADFFPWGLYLLRAPGEHRGSGRWAPPGEGSGCPKTIPLAEMAPPV